MRLIFFGSVKLTMATDVATIASLSVAVLLSIAILYTMFSRSSIPGVIWATDEVERFEERGGRADDSGEDLYKARLFVLKIFETLDRKPTAQEIDELSSVRGGRIAILQEILGRE